MKIIGLDVGEKRIGVSTADTSVKIATPYTTLPVDGTEFDRIKQLMTAEGTNLVVIGLPRNNQGTETAQSAITRQFAQKLQTRGAKIKLQDESLTSVQAEKILKSHKKPYKKEDIDAQAATLILQDFIENYKPPSKDNIRSQNEQNLQTSGSGRVSKRGVHTPTSSPTAAPAPHEDGRARERATRDGVSEVLRSRAKKPIGTIIVCSVFVLFFLTASAGALWFISGIGPVKNSPLRQPITITQGQSTTQIAQTLHQAGLIKNETVFTLAALITRASIPAKTHFISPSENIWQILDQISDK